VSDNVIGPKGSQILGDTAVWDSPLISFDLSQNKLPGQGILLNRSLRPPRIDAKLLAGIKCDRKQHPALYALKRGEFPKDSQSFNACLQSLIDLDRADEDMVPFSGGDEAIAHLLRRCPFPSVTLTLRESSTNSYPVRKYLDAVGSNPNITRLDLSGSLFSGGAWIQLAELLKKNKTLVHLNISRCKIEIQNGLREIGPAERKLLNGALQTNNILLSLGEGAEQVDDDLTSTIQQRQRKATAHLHLDTSMATFMGAAAGATGQQEISPTLFLGLNMPVSLRDQVSLSQVNKATYNESQNGSLQPKRSNIKDEDLDKPN